MGDAFAGVSAAAPPVAPISVPLRLNATQCADVHGDELAACEPKQTVPFSVALESVALAAMSGAELSFEATMTPLGWEPRS